MHSRTFKALAATLAVAILTSISGLAQVSLVSPGATWKYLDNGTDPGPTWTGLSFADGAWASGPGPLGYSTDNDTTFGTTVGFGGDEANKFPTTYFRHVFNVPDASSITNLRARVQRDDGVQLFLNGVLILKDTITNEVVAFDTYTVLTATDDGQTFNNFSVSPAVPLLVDGNNMLAAEVHQANATSSDLVFELALLGNPFPEISISSPTNTQIIIGQTLTITGTAVPGGDSVVLVEVFEGLNKIGESLDANFAVLWQNVTPGHYTLTANVTDNSGLTATSAPVAIEVQPIPPSTLVPSASSWKYFKGTQEASTPDTTAWRQLTFNDASWLTGNSPFFSENAPPAYTGNTDLTADMGNAAGQGDVTCIFMRRVFQVPNPGALLDLTVDLQSDDGCIVWINGIEVASLGRPADPITFQSLAPDATGEPKTGSIVITDLSMLQPGNNVLAVQAFNQSTTSSDFLIELSLNSSIDNVAPTLVSIDPLPGSTVRQLTQIEVFFTEPVVNVQASDLLINGEPASSVSFGLPGNIAFAFPEPPTGTVNVAWANGHGITDASPLANPFVGGMWSYTLDPNAAPPGVFISEFMASNDDTLNDEDGDSTDWIELHNAGLLAADIGGYFLTDDENDLTKWEIPNVTILPNGYLIIFASEKDKTAVPGTLHANFTLRAGGEYLALVDPDTNVVSEFAPIFPEQDTDISYGRDRANPELTGFFDQPTPGAPNAQSGADFAPDVIFSHTSQTFRSGTTFFVTLSTLNPAAVIRYTTTTNQPTEASPVYAGPIQINGTAQIRARSFMPGLLPSPIRSEFYIALDAAVATTNSTLPLIIMHTYGGGTANQAGDKYVLMQVFEPRFGRSSLTNKPTLTTRGRFKIRGSSTAGYAKQSWAYEAWNEVDDDTEIELLGMPEESDWVFYAPNNFEPALIHNPLAHELSRQIGRYGTRTRFAEVWYVDDTGATALPVRPGDYNGIYAVEEKIKRDPNRVDIDNLQPEHNAPPEVTGGYLLKIDRADPGDSGFPGPGQTILYVDPKEPEIELPQRDGQEQYIRNFFTAFGTALNGAGYRDPVNGYARYIDVDSWIDHHVHNVITFNVDALRLSGYFYKTRDGYDDYGRFVPGKIFMGPVWDFDRTQGSTDNRDFNPRRWRSGVPDLGTDFFNYPWWARLFTDPDFWQKWIDRYQDLREPGQPLHLDRLHATIDSIFNEVREAHTRETNRWNIRPRTGVVSSADGGLFTYNFGTGKGFQSEIDFKRDWYSNRLVYADSQFLAKPVIDLPSGPVAAGTQLIMSAPEAGIIYYTLNGTDPRAFGGAVQSGVLTYSGPVSIDANAHVVARAFNAAHSNVTGANNPPISSSWSGKTVRVFQVSTPPLIVTEMMFHPVDVPLGDTNDPNNFEFIELKNIGPGTLNLAGYQFTTGILFDFSGGTVTSLGPNARVVLVKNLTEFTKRYGAVPNVAGEFLGNLANDGERIVLAGPAAETVHDFTYDDHWYLGTDGHGFSLVVANEGQARGAWSQKAGWRAGYARGGTPGQPEPADPGIPVILVNEVLTHTDLPLRDSIELYNPNPGDVNIGGWILSDDFGTPNNRIPAGRIISGLGHTVFTDLDFNSDTVNTNRNFTFRSAGDEVYLYSADGAGNLTGYVHGYDFGASLNGVSFGRHVTSSGEEHFVAQSARSLGSANAGPKVGPVVISEVMYRPPDVRSFGSLLDNERDEFVELYNVSGGQVQMFDPNATTNTWRLRDAVSFAFPMGVTLQPDEHVLVVKFDPIIEANVANAFRSKYGFSPSLRLFGPYEGKLGNEDDSVELVQPDLVAFYASTVVTGVLIDKVEYSSLPPWPLVADGIGSSLQRVNSMLYGDDVDNWRGGAPSPGLQYVPGSEPVIIEQPVSKTVVAFSDTTLSVQAGGTGPFQYQWLFNDEIIPGATGPVLSLPNFQGRNAGNYQVVVQNASSSVVSDIATLSVVFPVTISQGPLSVDLLPGQSHTFTVAATGTSPLAYQWRKNGVPIPGATQLTHTIPSAQRSDDALYDVIVSNPVNSQTSPSARLAVLIDPTPIVRPLSQTTVVGGSVTFSIETDGTLPMGYRWRRGNTTILNEILDSNISFLTLNNVQTVQAGSYSVILTNKASHQPGLLVGGFSLTVLADTDGDKLSDTYEDANGLNKNDGNDAGMDADGDGMTNKEEEIAGTNPQLASSYLKVEQISAGGGAHVEFQAAAGKTYTIAFKNGTGDPVWHKLQDVVAGATARTVTVNHALGEPVRLYRLITPRQATVQ